MSAPHPPGPDAFDDGTVRVRDGATGGRTSLPPRPRGPCGCRGLLRRWVPKDEAAAKDLAKRTLTNVYNQMPAWLRQAHRNLDEAVFAAYGWPSDMADEEVLARLLDLNLHRAAAAGAPPVAGASKGDEA
jgi:MmeI, C-terminal domain